MSTIKGQNLRIFANGKCVGAATSCQLHVGTEFQDVSTKDDLDSGWQVQAPSKLNWDVSVDALVDVEMHSTIPTEEIPSGGWYTGDSVTLDVGETLHINVVSTIENLLTGIVVPAGTVIASSENQFLSYTNNSSARMTVYPATDDYDSVLYYKKSSSKDFLDFADYLRDESDVTIRMSEASGTTEGDLHFSGTVKITDVSIQAQVDNYATYTVQMQGVGELTVED